MPPWSLHHLIIPLTALAISCCRPGEPENPASSPYSMVIDVSVTPCSVAPLASPLPQGESSVPNFTAAACAVVVAVVPEVGELPRPLLHAAVLKARTTTKARLRTALCRSKATALCVHSCV